MALAAARLEGTCETRPGTDPLRSGARAGAGRHAIHGQAAAIIVAADPLTLENQRFIIDQCLTLKLPAIHTYISEARSGALLTYGVDTANYGALADYVDRLLRGAKVADLPFQEPTSIKLAVNLKTASALGITVPAALLARADEVIE